MKKEIEVAMENLREAMINEWTVSQKETAIKAEKIKAHNEVLLAKEAVRNLEIR